MHLLTLAMCVVYITTAHGQIQLLKDISLVAATETTGQPGNLINVNGMLFFTANSDVGRELWKSDGTIEGTVLVKDIWDAVEVASAVGHVTTY